MPRQPISLYLFLRLAHTAVYRRPPLNHAKLPPIPPGTFPAISLRWTLKPLLQSLSEQFHDRDPRLFAGIAAGLVVLAGLIWLIIRLRRPSPDEIERRRREHLASIGRITDGVILDARTLSGDDSISPTPDVLVYSYRLAGVTYNCAQDVRNLPDQVLGFRIDQPVQLRYDPRNPGNSIIVSESWTGLWQNRD